MGVSINNTISQISNLVDVDVSPLSNGDALIYVSATSKWEATALPGGGDMLKATYDTDLDGVVDTAHDVSATPLITRSSVASQGGLLINIDNAIGDIARTTSGFIEDEKYGVYVAVTAAGSAQFKTGVITLEKVIRLETTNATGTVIAYLQTKNQVTGASTITESSFEIKPSTKYKVSCEVSTNNVAVNSVFIQNRCRTSTDTITGGANTSSKLSGTNGLTQLTYEFTSPANAKYTTLILANAVAGNIGYADFRANTLKFEEVVEPVANSLTSSSPSIVSFTAIGSTDNIDQSQLVSNNAQQVGGDGSTSALQTKLAQQFLPSKSKHTGLIFRKLADVGTFTGTVTINVTNDATNVPGSTVYATYTYSNAAWLALALDTDITVNLPCNLTVDGSTKYFYTIESSTTDAANYTRIRVGGGSPYTPGLFLGFYSGAWNAQAFDLYFKTLYYKPTTNFKASQNNSTVSISADEDGFLNGSVINLTTGSFSVPDVILTKWDGTSTNNSYQGNDVRKFTSYYSATSVGWAAGSSYNIISPTSATKTDGYVTKFQGLNYTSITTNIINATVGGTNVAGLAYSYDGVSYTEFGEIDEAIDGGVIKTFTIDVTGHSTVYISVYRKSGTDCRITYLRFNGTVDTSSLSTLRNYPTNKDVVIAYNMSLATATTTATYRATLYGFPAIEYATGVYQYLNIDTTATGSTVAFSSDGSSYTTVADGANIALSSTVNPLVWVKHNITANRLYLSSNDYNASSDKDGSNKMTVVYDVTSQGLTYTVDELLSEVNELKAAVYALQNP